jgi:hypothetical protein
MVKYLYKIFILLFISLFISGCENNNKSECPILNKKNEIIFIGLILFGSIILGLYQYKSNELKLAELNIASPNDILHLS